MSFLLYFLRRLVFVVPQIFLISFVTFVLVRLLPGDPARLELGPLASEETVEALRHKLHLDLPILEQYGIYLQELAAGDMGRSYVNGTAVTDDLIHRIPATLEVIVLAMLFVFLVLCPLAVITAAKTRNLFVRILRNISFGYGMLAGALPDFLLGLILIFVFFTLLIVLPGPEGRIGLLDTEPDFITGSILIDTLAVGDFATFWSAVQHLVMPVFTLAFVYGAPIFKMLRSSMEGGLIADYSIYAQVLGLAPRIVFMRALRVAAGPTIVMTGVVSGFLLGGAVLVETVFNLNGLGQYAVQSIIAADYAPLQGFVSFAAIFTMLVYLAVDLVYFATDPRARVSGGDR
jgi:peptide/nickel transport system permease protein